MIQCLNCRGCPSLNDLPNIGAWQNWGNDYISVVNSLQNIKLLVVGQDPYKIRATGIAFCKPTWLEYLDDQYSALTLFCSLGINLKKAFYDVSHFPTPKEFFIWLAEKHKVVFVNALIKKANKRKNDISDPNTPIWLNKADYSILCGKVAQSILTKKEDLSHIYVDHPSGLNRTNPHTSSSWFQFWGCRNSLLDSIKNKAIQFGSSQTYTDICQIVSNINASL